MISETDRRREVKSRKTQESCVENLERRRVLELFSTDNLSTCTLERELGQEGEKHGDGGRLERFTSFTWADFERGSATWTVSSGGSRQEFLSMLTLAFIAASSSASRVLRRS